MIDLSTRGKKFLYPIKLTDGTILKLYRPTQGMLIKMLDFAEAAQNDAPPADLLDSIYSLLVDIFNRNTEKRVFTKEEIEDMVDLSTSALVITDYLQETMKSLGE